eukprot:CAMPEP_0195583670 /NCGR_PEP_ID=MMETSP0814-20130614/24529_1 /TAXON_ID=97485 /ORGANISM="Prymnesium parvum, Strain Texoma1" /LENGTH=124 /DNA_ID=CAMNT_0040721553 /DNA_START=446 /DNA_END=817 /DNA_ORIENTATION=+
MIRATPASARPGDPPGCQERQTQGPTGIAEVAKPRSPEGSLTLFPGMALQLGAAQEEAEKGEDGARVLELLVTHAADRSLEQKACARELQQQPRLEDKASMAHLPEGREQLWLALCVLRRRDPR